MDYKIVNEVEIKKTQREVEKREQLKKEGKKPEEIEKVINPKKDEEKQEVVVCRNATDIQKRKLDRLMKDPEKGTPQDVDVQNQTRDVYIPEPRKERKLRDPPEFVRHVMGSSAGAGSGEFHVYRNLRKRERKRQEFLDWKATKNDLDDQYHDKIEGNKQKAEDATAKKRAKRQRKKQKKLLAKKLKKSNPEGKDNDEDDNDDSDDDNDEDATEENQEDEEPHFQIGGK